MTFQFMYHNRHRGRLRPVNTRSACDPLQNFNLRRRDIAQLTRCLYEKVTFLCLVNIAIGAERLLI